MISPPRCPWLLLAPLVLAASARAQAGAPEDRLRALSLASGERAPVLRIGLEAGHDVTIASAAPFRLLDAATGQAEWRGTFDTEVHVVAVGGPLGSPRSVFRVQVGAYSSEAAAEAERRRLEQLAGVSGVVRRDDDRGVFRVRLGQADERLALGPLVERLRGAGVDSPWIAEEPELSATPVPLLVVDSAFVSHAASADRLVAVPAAGALIRVDGHSFRGVVELRASPHGTVQPIDWIGLESYLRGVVPAELGPEMWPQPAALAAQAVAARTYAWRNRGQFSGEGFDLCATPRCQVYSGADAEHPLSDRAVAETAGRILVYDGQPIAALYTATCGGHTEAGGEIFPEHDRPYLRGVPCRAEGEALAALRGTLRGRPVEPVLDETGADVTRDWTLLEQAGVVGGSGEPRAAAAAADARAVRRWTAALCGRAGRPAPGGPPRPAATLGQAAVAILADLGWGERSRVLLADADLRPLLRDPETEALDEGEARALAYLASVEAVRPFPDGRFRAGGAASAARLAPVLVRIGESYRAFGLEEATVARVGPASLGLVRGKGSLRLALAPHPALFALAGGRPAPAERLDLWPGDDVRYRVSDGGAIDFLELLPPVRGAADDRSSRVFSWEVRRSRRELETAINARVAIGTLRDLEVLRRGVSGRVVELRIVGDRGSTVVRGFDVRRLLDLRESLLVIEPQRDARGEIEAVVFAGKGWGHGVGLCQVGAFGMALRGSSYQEILAHYYPGTRLARLDPRQP